MGSGAMQKLSEASPEEMSAAYQDLSAEAQANLKEALAALHKANGLSIRSMVSGEVTATMQASADSSYADLVKALRKQLPELQTKVVKFFVPQEPMDEHKTLGEQGVDPKGEVQYTVADFSVGTKLTPEEAGPILESTAAGFNGLAKNDIEELKALKFPPWTVQLSLGATAVLLQKPHDSWDDIKKMLSHKDFLSDLVSFEKDKVSIDTLNELTWYISHPKFQRDEVRKASAACTCLRDWVEAVNTYATTMHRVSM